MKTIIAMILAASIMFFGLVFSADAAIACGQDTACTERSDPYFRELNALRARMSKLEGRVGNVETAVKSLAGRVGQPTQLSLQTILYGKLPQGIKITFTGTAEMGLKGIVDARKLIKEGYSVKEIILVPPAEADETTRDVMVEKRMAALLAEYGAMAIIRAPVNPTEVAELAAAGVGAGNALVHLHLVPKP